MPAKASGPWSPCRSADARSPCPSFCPSLEGTRSPGPGRQRCTVLRSVAGPRMRRDRPRRCQTLLRPFGSAGPAAGRASSSSMMPGLRRNILRACGTARPHLVCHGLLRRGVADFRALGRTLVRCCTMRSGWRLGADCSSRMAVGRTRCTATNSASAWVKPGWTWQRSTARSADTRSKATETDSTS